MTKALLVIGAIAVVLWLVYRRFRTPRPEPGSHEAPPERVSEIPLDVEAFMAQVKATEYFARLQPLRQFVEGRTVVRSETGNAGFVLHLDNGSWVAAFRDGDRVGHAKGTGEPNHLVRAAIATTEYGDASEPIPRNLPYADERCDIASEVRKSHAQVLEGLAFGLDSFNFAFADGHELDVALVDDRQGRPAFRVFWERW